VQEAIAGYLERSKRFIVRNPAEEIASMHKKLQSQKDRLQKRAKDRTHSESEDEDSDGAESAFAETFEELRMQ
jgi:hypothetical protein